MDARAGGARFRRSRDHRMVAGVCGGIAEYFGVAPMLVRLVFIAFTLAGGSGILLYLILWVVVPSEPRVGVES